MEAAIDFSFVYESLKDMYLEVFRPNIDPVILITLNFIQYTFSIRSICKTIKEVKMNIAYSCF
jgi:transposase